MSSEHLEASAGDPSKQASPKLTSVTPASGPSTTAPTAFTPSVYTSAPVIIEAARRIEGELRRTTPPLNVSSAAWAELANAQAEHLSSVGIEAARIARRSQLGTVDTLHIRAANRHVMGSPRGTGVATASLAVGGVIGGAGVAFAMEIANRHAGDPPLTTSDLLVAMISTVVGAILLVIGIAITINNSKR